MKKSYLTVMFLFAISCNFLITTKLYTLHSENRSKVISSLIYLPKEAVKIISLEFSGPLSNYLMLKTMAFHGERLLARQKLSVEEWQNTYLALDQITHLDPRFLDPYVLAQSSLPWDAGMVKETNELLHKAAKARPDDYRPYFFLWFNHRYFLKDPVTAARYMKKSARASNAPVYFVTMVGRNSVELGETESGILYLEEILKETKDPKRAAWIRKRLKALIAIQFLEKYVEKFKDKYGRLPSNLEELVGRNLLKRIPPDPYGGEFFLTPRGRIYTTSKLSPMKVQSISN